MKDKKYLNTKMFSLPDELKQEIESAFLVVDSMVSNQRAPDDSLLSGNLGLVIYHSSIAKVRNEEKHLQCGLKIIEEIIDKIQNSKSSLLSYQFSVGLAGLGVVLYLLKKGRDIDFDFKSEFEFIDESIFESAMNQVENGYVEFLLGGAGALFYFNFREESPKLTIYKNLLIESLFKQIEKDPMGIRIPTIQYGRINNTDYDLSLAHGLCGVMHVLLSCLENGKINNSERVLDYLNKSANFISSLKKPSIYAFPTFLQKDIDEENLIKTRNWPNSRLAWCYGDIGWLLFFYKFYNFTKELKWRHLADEVGLTSTLRRSELETGSLSSHICHGHSGLALCYKKLYFLSGKSVYMKSSLFWLKQTLSQLKIDIETNYFKNNNLETSLLEGLPGVGLILASFDNIKIQPWERLLLI